VGGDVVNIYHKPTPYRVKIGLRARATTAAPVVINGVTSTACDKPVFDFKDARTSPGSSNVFSSTPAYGESLGGIVIKRGTGDAWDGPKPSGIVIQGLELRGAANGNSYTTLAGATAAYGSGAAVYVLAGADITLQNVTITDSGFGLFVMAKDDSLTFAGERITLRNSRVYGNGIVGSYLEHNVYMQAASPLTEGNFFGQLRAGAEGSSYKDRSAGVVFRRNVVVASARAIDFVHSEDQSNGIAALPNYGTDYVYENQIISSGPEAIHYGGDNMGEQEGGLAVVVPPLKYRSKLFFWKNKFTLTSNGWRAWVFDLSLKDTTVNAWDNTFDLRYTGGGRISWMEWAGAVKLGNNIVTGTQPVKNRDGAVDSMSVLTTGNTVPVLPPGL
jgi:Right handed beta helix region